MDRKIFKQNLKVEQTGCAIDVDNNQLVMTREFLVPMVIDALNAQGTPVTESNIEAMLDIFREEA